MRDDSLACLADKRRTHLFGNPNWNGIDFIEVCDDPPSLCVHFFGQVPENITAANIRIDGGRPIRDIHVTDVTVERAEDPEHDDCLHITLDKVGDFSCYRLCLICVPSGYGPCDGEFFPGLDPRYACADFHFRACCPSDADCGQPPTCAEEPLPRPEINYLAKDYASFRQLILDRLSLIMPDWRERHAPDLGIALVELLAYVGDYLSYYQDAVATEAYLDTARLRISVRRHARLVGYRMHEGTNTRALVTVDTTADLPPLLPSDIFFAAGLDGIERSSGRVVREEDLERIPANRYKVFEPLVAKPDKPLVFRQAHSTICFYTWGDGECCLRRGATRATLLDEQRALALEPGDVLIFEEVIGPTTGNAADADPTHRHAVRLTKVTQAVDHLLDDKKVLEIEWDACDALPFPLCLSARLSAPDCRYVEHISVARGNIVLVDHGRTTTEPAGPVETDRIVGTCGCDGASIEMTTVPRPFTPVLSSGPLTFADPLDPCACATDSVQQDPRLARPRLWLIERLADDTDVATGPAWESRDDLFSSGADDRHFVTEVDDDGLAHVRFGDGVAGRLPAAGTRFDVRYRVGNGPDGNAGRDTITHFVCRKTVVGAEAILPRNPMETVGGTVPEPLADVKLFAPHAYRTQRARAITADDYAELAERNAALQRAAAELRWTGSWYEAHVAIDPAHTADVRPQLRYDIAHDLSAYRRMLHDLAVVPARYVPLHIALEVCVRPSYPREQVRAALRRRLGSRRLPDGTLGLFHPDKLTFGESVRLSPIIAAAMAVDGVDNVRVTRFTRQYAAADGELEAGLLELGSMEIAQLDDDPNFADRGTLELTLRGGR